MKSNPESDRLYIDHMLESIGRVHGYVSDGEAAFKSSNLLQDAVVRNLQVMAESSQRLSEECRSRLLTVPWRAISGFRNILVHDYLGLDVDVIWKVIQEDLPPLEKALRSFQH
jgi:uncharacterized protein with HEPN domain